MALGRTPIFQHMSSVFCVKCVDRVYDYYIFSLSVQWRQITFKYILLVGRRRF